MPIFEVNASGKSYEVEAPDMQTVVRALSGMSAPAAAPDKYQQAALDERNALQAKGVDTNAGFARRIIQGATFNTADEILAGLSTPLEMVRHGTFSPREGYNYAKAREDLIMDDVRKNTGALGMAAELAGGALTGSGLARAGVTFAPQASAGLAARSLGSAADAAAMGAVAGGAEGNTAGERGMNALSGAALGGVVGGAAPGVLGLAGAALSPITSNIAARSNPQRYATSQVARAISESGRTPQQITDDLAQAAREGQGMYTAADAMGNAGQRMLSSTARAPGPGRTEAVEFLENRQAGQGRRIANQLAEGFDSPKTAVQTRDAMTAARDAAADAEYGAVRQGSNRVDVVGPINHLDEIIGTAPGQQLQAPNDSIEAVLRGFRERLARVNPDDFAAVQRIRGDMADAAQSAAQAGHGNRSRLIGGAVRQLDTAMEAASAGFRQANANFRQASQNIAAIDQGRTAAIRGRAEDTIPVYQALTPEGQQAFRAGYVDPLIEQAQGAASTANKARPLINDAFADESAAVAPNAPLLNRQLARENTMFQTRNAALGNSKTAENLADDAAMGVAPTLASNILRGNWSGAARNALQAGQNALTGNTPEVRQEVARLMLTRHGQSRDFQSILQEAIDRVQQRQAVSAALGRGASGVVALLPSATRDTMAKAVLGPTVVRALPSPKKKDQ
ncbi:hypothetical protein [Bradyrhizobium liaoningense]|uniref:hypothetical protein n=1 Tax=Bradyrhizobium liaoningense TaxID=43992 RepID=UPI001BAB45F4|nr:hypothetical protein [Bradyrhizobium liaoningense]MBR0901204.1 hypothetical protein [Bradyrhizobium liaoningense]